MAKYRNVKIWDKSTDDYIRNNITKRPITFKTLAEAKTWIKQVQGEAIYQTITHSF